MADYMMLGNSKDSTIMECHCPKVEYQKELILKEE